MKTNEVLPNLKLIPIPPLFPITFPTPQATESKAISKQKIINLKITTNIFFN